MLNYYDLGITFPAMNRFSSNDSTKSIERSELRKPCCLIIAADENLRLLFKTLLEIWDYDVTEARSVEETFWQVGLKCPDVVLMDMQINFSDSLTTMQILKAKSPLDKTPFILLSGHAQTEIRQTVIAAGAKDFCVKPVDFNVLKTILETSF